MMVSFFQSISALQWLCNADKTSHLPKKRLLRFFETLYMCLAQGARAVFQFYPENPEQIELLTSCAMRVGFRGGLLVDFPNSTKAKKYFLCLFAGVSVDPLMPKALGIDDMGIEKRERSHRREHKQHHRMSIKHRDWVLHKKETMRRKGYNVPIDSIYTARRRGPRF
jgi:18S rRNA (guanine1575-N7)-methyltransferase